MSAWGIAPGNRLALDKARKRESVQRNHQTNRRPKMNGASALFRFSRRRIPGRLPQALNERCAFGAKRMRAMSSPSQQSLHGHTLGEVARFIDIAAQFDGQMICEKLKRDDIQDR